VGVAKVIGCEAAVIFRQQNLVRMHDYLAEGCHLYLVSRRPRTFIEPTSVRIRHGRIRGRFVVELASKPSSWRFETPFWIDAPEKLILSVDAAKDYYQVIGKRSGRTYVHGDTWALALLSSYCRPDLAEQEVLYIGQSFGKEGELNALDRIIRHEKIQKIYADHQSAQFDIYITLLRISDAASLIQLGSAESFASADRAGIASLVASTLRPGVDRLREQVTLAEASLISYFKPEYNQHHKQSFPGMRSRLARNIDTCGFTNLDVSVSTGETGIRFWSAQRRASRYHRFSCRLPSAADPSDGYLGIAAEEMEERLNLEAQSAAAAMAYAPVTLAILPSELPERMGRGGLGAR